VSPRQSVPQIDRRAAAKPRSRTQPICLITIFLVAAPVFGQTVETAGLGTTAVRRMSASAPSVAYQDGQLEITATETSLGEILRRITAATGTRIDIPASANMELIPFVRLGPGAPRAIVASLLRDSDFDYLIQGTTGDPDSIASVLLIARDKTPIEASRPARSTSPYARAAAPPASPDRTPEPQRETVAAAEPASDPPPAAVEEPVPDARARPAASLGNDGPRPGALAPPTSLDSQTIIQQLQQMYQQRVQMLQQDRQGTAPK
jgi:hypothetical protein